MDYTKFYNSRYVPKNLTEYEIAEWYNERLGYVRDGFIYKGSRITGDHYWFLNYVPINLTYTTSGNQVVDEVNFPFYCQTDDWLFKQIEEADQAGKKAILLITGRGFGKTLTILSTGLKEFWFRENFYGIISSSSDALVNPCFSVFKDSIERINKAHPAIAVPLLKSKDDFVRIGETLNVEGEENRRSVEAKGTMEKITYGNHAGKTKGRRIHWQLMEEIGSWDQPGVAPLKRCIGNSEGTWIVQNTPKARVFMIGTGGEVSSTTIKDLYYNPDDYNIFVPTSYEKRKGIFIPCTDKMFYEETGIPDRVKAKEYHDNKRLALKDNIDKYLVYCSEFPYTEDEVFRLKGTNSFPQDLIAKAIQNITEFKTSIKPRRGKFFRNKQSDLSQGIVFEESPEGPVWMYEEPEKNYNILTGERTDFSNLYIAGYDGIDQGTSDSSSKGGSSLALLIKKGMNPNLKLGSTVNKYVLKINYRPQEVEDAYEQSMLALIYYNAKVNIEFSKINIVSYFKKHGQHWRFIKRPKLTVSDGLQEKDTNLIGTIANATNWGYGIGFIKQHVKDSWDQLDDLEMCEQLKDFTYENKTDFDIISAMCWCEIAYSEVIIKPMTENTKEMIDIGYYTDPMTGQKKYGQKPVSFSIGISSASLSNIKYIDLQKNKVVYDNE